MDKTSRTKHGAKSGRTCKKDTTMSTPSSVEEIKIQDGVFDLDTMDELTLKKTVSFSPVSSMEEAATMLGNDASKLLAVINDGLREHVRETAKSNASIPWMVEDEDGKLTPFTGTPAEASKVNPLILNMAKSVYGYTKDLTREAKRAAKEAAIALIRNTPAIRDGLKNSAK